LTCLSKENYEEAAEITRIHPSTHTFANSDMFKKKNREKPKKSSLFSILFFLEFKEAAI